MGFTIDSPGLATDTEEQLLDQYGRGELAAREELVRRFLPLTRRLAGRYSRSGESQDDLEQVACLGLLKAIDRYDPDRARSPAMPSRTCSGS